MGVEIRRVPLIPGRLLEIDAVAEDLPIEFGDEYLLADGPPAFGALENAELRPEVEESEGLARQMRVRAVIRRKVFFKMPSVLVQELQRLLEKLGRQAVRSAEEMKRPDPRYRAQGDLEAAHPIDTVARRVLRHPTLKMACEGRGVTLLAGQKIRDAEREEMLVAVDLPNDLLVARFL